MINKKSLQVDAIYNLLHLTKKIVLQCKLM